MWVNIMGNLMKRCVLIKLFLQVSLLTLVSIFTACCSSINKCLHFQLFLWIYHNYLDQISCIAPIGERFSGMVQATGKVQNNKLCKQPMSLTQICKRLKHRTWCQDRTPLYPCYEQSTVVLLQTTTRHLAECLYYKALSRVSLLLAVQQCLYYQALSKRGQILHGVIFVGKLRKGD